MKKLLAFVFFGAFAVFSISVKNRALRETEASKLEALPNGKPMPDFTLTDTTGQEYTLSKLTAEKKLVLVNFWGVWCTPCRLEMPGFEKMYKQHSKNGFVILAIDENDERPKLDAYLKEKPVSFPVLLDPDGALAKRFGIRSYPTSVLVGSDGKILQVFEGMSSDLSYIVDFQLKRREEKK